MKNAHPYYSFAGKMPKGIKEDYFFNSEDFDWAKKIEENYVIIKSEILNHMNSGSAEIKPYFNKEMMNLPGKWKTFSFYFWGIEGSQSALESCPKTVGLFSSIEGITSFSVSITEAQSEIKPHRGDTDAIYRCHLGIEIPAGLPDCGFYVGYEERPWEEGKILIFNDTAYHKGWNKTDKARIIVLFDILRPEFVKKKKWICSRILGSLLFSIFNSKLRMVAHHDYFFRNLFSFIFAVPVYFTQLAGIKKTIFARLLKGA